MLLLGMPAHKSSARRASVVLCTVCCGRAAIVLQYDYAVGLDFGGIDSQGAASAIARAQKAGMCSALQLRAAAALAVAADRIRKQVHGWCDLWSGALVLYYDACSGHVSEANFL